MRQERTGLRRWQDVRPHVVTDEKRVAEHRAQLAAEDRAHEQAVRARRRGSSED
jgi:hypothetical protein